jgi:hypothetical protein
MWKSQVGGEKTPIKETEPKTLKQGTKKETNTIEIIVEFTRRLSTDTKSTKVE